MKITDPEEIFKMRDRELNLRLKAIYGIKPEELGSSQNYITEEKMTNSTEEKITRAIEAILTASLLIQSLEDIQNCDMDHVRASRKEMWEVIDGAVAELVQIARGEPKKKGIIKRRIKLVPKTQQKTENAAKSQQGEES